MDLLTTRKRIEKLVLISNGVDSIQQVERIFEAIEDASVVENFEFNWNAWTDLFTILIPVFRTKSIHTLTIDSKYKLV